jgi:FlaA1/EpsC-like NDP-sugar epimerase
MIDWLLALPRMFKRVIVLCVDLCLCVLTVWFAFYLRLGEWVSLAGGPWIAAVVSMLISIPLFVSFGLYREIFRHVGWSALASTAQACLIYAICFGTVFVAWSIPDVPRTIGLAQPVLLFVAVAATRLLAKYWLGGAYRHGLRRKQRRSVLIFGAGAAGRQLATALANSDQFRAIGYIDDDATMHGSMLDGLRVWGRDKVEWLIAHFDVSDVFLAIPSASKRRRNEVVDFLQPFSVSIRTLPGLMDLAHGRVQVTDLRPLAIEDLLGRDPVSPHPLLLGRNITGKTVLVTGAGGSIGSEICRQVAALEPARLVLVDLSEFALYSIHRELDALAAARSVDIVPLIASVQNRELMRQILEAWRPQTIYHAAAYKHVPLVEHNVCEGVLNNVAGTLVTAQAAEAAGVADFVLISTDKAVRPTNIMGASKRLAEMCLQALAERSETRFSMVRFGNVLGSSGSVVPLFREQIANGGPITLTHPEITRYFMTIPEASELVIQAGAMATGGEVFVLDMGNPVKILDLARRMVELSGMTVKDAANPDGDIEIAFVGLRPGEKLYEELLIGDDPRPTVHPLIMKANEAFLPWHVLKREVEAIETAARNGDAEQVRRRLSNVVSGFKPDARLVDATFNRQRARA